jgi:hypothetical protein
VELVELEAPVALVAMPHSEAQEYLVRRHPNRTMQNPEVTSSHLQELA